ncbi:CHASE domain-containing protein [Lentibacter algarum]|nr:CHASE domain-containing protein [Lentibacter algarum]
MFVDRLERNRTIVAFERHADETFEVLINRIDGYSRTLDGASALFATHGGVSALDWQYYVDSLNIEETLPGTLGIGYITLVKEVEGVDISSQMLERGVLLPPVHPDTGLPERFVVQFIEPLEQNRAALALDMGFEPERRRSAQIARETNTIQLTPPIELVQNDGRELGFLLLRPHYKARMDISTPKAMEDAFEGWLYMPFVGQALFTTLTSSDDPIASLSVRDTGADSREVLVFNSLDRFAEHEARFTITREVDFFGRHWSLTWHSTPMFEKANRGLAKWIVLVLGLTIFSLIGYISRVLSSRESKIEIEVERKTVELRAKSEETLSVIENAVIAILVLDEKERILSANPAAMQLFNAVDVRLGMRIQSLISFRANADGMDRAARCPTLPSLRLHVQKNEWSSANGFARSTLLIQDVSESTAYAQRLQENEARWNLAMKGAQIGVFDIDLVTNRSIVSDTWRMLMRVPLSATDVDTQKLFLSRIHPEDLPILQAADKACIDGLTDRSTAEYRIRFEDGSVRWMKSDAVVTERDKNGKALRLIGAQTDETDLHEARNALKASRERFELVLEQAPVGMALFSGDGRFLGKNEALCRMTGYEETEMANGLRFHDLLSREDHAMMKRVVKDLITQSQSSHQGEYKIIPKNGPAIWGLLSVAWTFDPTKNADVFIVQIIDISEKKNIEKMKAEFVATVSHELRTPLTSIKGALGLMRGPMLPKMPDGAERLLEIAYGNTERVSALVNDILDLEKIRSGEIDFQLEPTDLNEILEAGVEQMLPFAAQHGVEMSLDLPESPIVGYVDSQRTQQVIANLISNACKYSDDNTTVHIRLEAVGTSAIVCVINSGPAISDDFKAKIFQPFSQADASDTRAKGGTGLGLNISRQLVERMNGQIGFKSDLGEPTAFWFTVPLARSDNVSSDSDQSLELPQHQFSVLHLEDDSDFSEIVRKGLGNLAKMRSVPTLAQARAAIRSEVFDLIVVDWDLPDGNGHELLNDLQEFQKDARVISLSASETSVRDIRVDHAIVKSRLSLNEIVREMVKHARLA